MTAVRFSVFRSRKGAGLSRRSRRKAAVVVETALCVALVLLPLSLGILQFGVILATSNQVEQITRDGGRWAAVHAQNATFDSADTVTGSWRNYMKTQTAGTIVQWSDITCSISPGTATARVVGDSLTVNVTYPMTKKIFIGSTFPGLSKWNGNYTTHATFVMEQGVGS